MPSRDIENDDKSKRPDDEIFECPMCHQQVPPRQSIVMGGRRLCFGCASGWYEDEDPDEPLVPR